MDSICLPLNWGMWSNSDDLAASAKLGKTTHPHSVKKLLPPLAYHVPQENNWRLGHICQEHWGEAMADAFRGICNFRHHKLSEIESYFEGFRYTEPGSSSQVDDNGCLYKLYINYHILCILWPANETLWKMRQAYCSSASGWLLWRPQERWPKLWSVHGLSQSLWHHMCDVDL